MSKSNKRQRHTGSPDSEGAASVEASPVASPQDRRLSEHLSISSKDARKKAKKSSKEKSKKSPPGTPSVVRLAEGAATFGGVAHAEGG
jgi:hypothetical protein